MTEAALRREVLRKRPDYLIPALTGVLLLIGLQAVYSATFALGVRQYGSVGYFVTRQSMWAGVGLIMFIVGSRVNYRRWIAWSPWIMLGCLGALAAVLVPSLGLTRYGATRWLQIGPFGVQPSEFIKLSLILYVSAWLATRGERLRSWSSGFLPFVIIVGLVGGLIMLQPDLGTTLIILFVTAILFFVGGADLRQFLVLAVAGLAAMAMLIAGAGYRSDRWEAFVNPWDDPAGKGFHIIQLLIALGSGGVTGLGIGASRQKFFYVPGSHTDGIFAIIGEEVGFVGAILVIAVFAALVWRGFKVASAAPDQYGGLVAVGITCWLGFQALINIGGITRSIPLTGIPLPFISYGGSSLAVSMAAIGILFNISKYGLPSRQVAPAPA
ncbi:MAG: putative lipid II flippase FtsW [Chloroflexi bacterium]|nr:putative lipid II flippase FtsW [Chloroflexota bacterium]